MSDELDVARDKGLRLIKAEAQIEKYQQRLEEMIGLKKQNKELSDRMDQYLDQVTTTTTTTTVEGLFRPSFILSSTHLSSPSTTFSYKLSYSSHESDTYLDLTLSGPPPSPSLILTPSDLAVTILPNRSTSWRATHGDPTH